MGVQYSILKRTARETACVFLIMRYARVVTQRGVARSLLVGSGMEAQSLREPEIGACIL